MGSWEVRENISRREMDGGERSEDALFVVYYFFPCIERKT
jgi:hypothetical protein